MPNPEKSGPVDELFDVTKFLQGRTSAWGIFEDRFGRLRRRFTVEMNGYWSGSEFLLDEEFVYDTGDREARTWRIVPGDGGRFKATCDDCVGEASGACTADGVRMAYRFRLKLATATIVVAFDDRIYRMGEASAVNRATLRKWGVKLGELSLFFERKPGPRAESGGHPAAARTGRMAAT